jgi:predicted nucleic acid-binding protein
VTAGRDARYPHPSLQPKAESVSPPLAFVPVAYFTPPVEDRALEVQLLLCDLGQHRAPSIPDLLVAALAEISGFTILALDKNFE